MHDFPSEPNHLHIMAASPQQMKSEEFQPEGWVNAITTHHHWFTLCNPFTTPQDNGAKTWILDE